MKLKAKFGGGWKTRTNDNLCEIKSEGRGIALMAWRRPAGVWGCIEGCGCCRSDGGSWEWVGWFGVAGPEAEVVDERTGV